jgi:hypothetical protein
MLTVRNVMLFPDFTDVKETPHFPLQKQRHFFFGWWLPLGQHSTL